MTKKNPLVSIGIPVHNSQQYIQQCIDSLSKQIYQNIELIISDNASTDLTYSLCKKFTYKDKRISLYRQEKNTGPIKNFNFVLNKAKGKYFMWAAYDDIFHKTYIKKLVYEMEKHPNVVLAVSAVTNFDDHNRKLNFYLKFKKISKTVDALKIYLLHPRYVGTLFYGIYRTSVIKKIKLHQDRRPYYNGLSDILTVFNVLLQGNLVYISKLLFYKRDTGYYLSILDHLSSLNFSQLMITRIKTYLLFPIGHTYDFFNSIQLTLESSLSGKDKIAIALYCCLKLFRDFYVYIWDICRGFVAILKGIINNSKKHIFLPMHD